MAWARNQLGKIQRHRFTWRHSQGTYLLADAGNTSPYQDGGRLYALGLIHANHGSQKMITYLIDQLKVSFDSHLNPSFRI